MDHSDISALLKVGVLVLIGIVFLVVFIRHMNRKEQRVEIAKTWPSTEATVQSAEMEVLQHSKYGSVTLPCFAFSYVVANDYYSGRFALNASGEKAADLIKRLVGRKLNLHYDPQKPDDYYIPSATLEGCDLEQRINVNLAQLYPKD